ncbi:MAG TPA: choice-of-anchor tandem repeat GloVer-containing protein [Cyclobacteriaceae bacterium]
MKFFNSLGIFIIILSLLSCKLEDGLDGLDGLDGMTIGMITEDIGDGCSRLTFFEDTNRNSLLESNEDVLSIIDLCDGNDGLNGSDGLTFVFDFIDANNQECPDGGGVIIDVYLDVDKDGVVSDGDILTKTTIHCFNIASVSSGTYMFGTTADGGANNFGTIFRTDGNGLNFQKVFDFNEQTGGQPGGGLTLAPNGKLYGFTTTIFDANFNVLGLGSFYEFDPKTNSLTVLKQFPTDSEFGWGFVHSPLLASDGLLYASSPFSGAASFGNGKIWSYDPSSGTFSAPVDIDASLYGPNESKLMQASDGNIYFTTASAGNTYGYGVITRFDPQTSTFTVIHESRGNNSANFDAGQLTDYVNATNNPLFEASNGVLYGCSRNGGNSFNGNLFKINKDGSGYQVLFIFSQDLITDGWRPAGGFVERNGKLYSSTTQHAGLNQNSGTFYTVDINSGNVSFEHILDFEGILPLGTFTESPNGRLYITCSGGEVNGGSIVEWNLTNNTITQRRSFDTTDNGLKPTRNELAIVSF